MTFTPRHNWHVSAAEARQIQRELAIEVICEDEFDEVGSVAGVDVGFEDDGQTTRAAVVVLDFPTLTVLEWQVVRQPTIMPYIPGYLSFREVPAIITAVEKLTQLPDLILCDGQGLAHPRRFGLACHLGVLTGLPTIGVAKTYFIGTHEPVGEEKGAFSTLWHQGEEIGVVLRSRTGVRPIYVSIGHKVSLSTAVAYTLACAPKYRLPETTRQAHRYASVVKDV